MDITPSLMYWATRCTPIRGVAEVVAVLSLILLGLALIVCMFLWGDDLMDTEDRDSMLARCGKFIKIGVVMLIFGTTVWTLTPTSKEIAAILVIPRIANSETVQELGSGVVDLAKEWINELHPNKKGDK